MRSYRQPTEKESKKLEEARKKTVEGIEGEKDIFSKISTTMAKSARDDIKTGKAMRESVPAAAREGEAYEQAGYRNGGKVMKKMRKFEEGGYTGDDEIVKYRMGMIDAKGKDISKKSDNPTVEPTVKTETKQGEHPKIDAATRLKAVRENAPRYVSKGLSPKSINPDRLVRKDILNQFPNSGNGEVRSIPLESYEYDDAGYKSGGKVKSASSRADGCAIRGKTRA